MFFPKEIKSSIEKSKENKSSGLSLRDKNINRKDLKIINHFEKDSKKEENNSKQSNISSTEKIKYGKIAKSFIEGGKENFNSLYLKIKFQEIKKAKNRYDKILSKFSFKEEDKKRFKENKKSSKKKNVAKLLLIGGVIGVTAYLIKKSYDTITNFVKKLNFTNCLDAFIPVSLTYHSKGNKQIDGEEASYVITTKSGDEISISDPTPKNDIEDAAKNVDRLLIDDFMGKNGLAGFINPDNIESSVMGYLAYKPLFHFNQKINHYFIHNLKNPKIDAIFKIVYWQVSKIVECVIDDVATLTNRGRFSNIILSSQDGYTNTMAKIKNVSQTMLEISYKNVYGLRVEDGGKGAVKLYLASYENKSGDQRDAFLKLPDADSLSKRVKNLVETHSFEEIKKIAGNLNNDNANQAFWIARGETTGRTLISIDDNFHLQNKKYEKLLKYLSHDSKDNHHVDDEMEEYMNIRFDQSYHHGLYVGRGDKEEQYKEEYESLVENIGPAVKTFESFLENEIFPLIMEAKIRKMYIEDVLKNRDAIVEKIVKEKINFLKTDLDNSIIEEEIYKNDISTREKMEKIVGTYFSRSAEKNIFIKYIKNLESEFNLILNDLYTLFDRFSTSIFPFAKLGLSNDKNNDRFGHSMMNFYNSSSHYINEYNEGGSVLSLSDVVYMEKISSFSKLRLRFRKKKIKNLYDAVVSLKKIMLSSETTKYREYNTGENNDFIFLKEKKGANGEIIKNRVRRMRNAVGDMNKKIKIPNEEKIKNY